MNKFLTSIFGASWRTSLTGLIGGVAIAAWPIVQSAIQTQLQGVTVNWNNVLMGVVVAVGGHFAKDHNVSNSPTPIAEAKPVS